MAKIPDRPPIGTGCPPGKGTITPAHGGRIGNPPYVPTDKDRAYVREYVVLMGQRATALKLGISQETLRRHYRDEIDAANDEAIFQVASRLYKKALEGDGPSIRFFLISRGRGEWSPKVKHEHTGAEGGPIRKVDLTGFIEGKSEEELAALESVLEKLAAAGDLDFTGDGAGGFAADTGGAAEG